MQYQTVRIVLYSPLEKGIIGLAAAVHDQWLISLFTTAYEQQRIFLIQLLCHLVKKIECQAVHVHQLLLIRKNKPVSGFVFFYEFTGPTHRKLAVHVLWLFLARPSFANRPVRVVDDLDLFDKVN